MSINSGIADSWFFIRYADPQPHLRIRWHGEPEILLRHLLPQVTELTAELADEGTIGHLSVDTYEREIERYGGVDAMMESELIFSADSEAVVGLLDAFAGSGSPDPLELAVLSIDTLLGDLGLNSEERLRWFDQQIRTADVATQKAAGAEYRNHASRLRSVLNEGITAFGPDIAAVLGERSRRVRPVAETVHSMIAHGRLSVAETSWLASHVHMHCNRLLTPPMATREGEILHVLRRVRHGLTQQLRESTN
jgi:thiopeptide-type bacteriocin biosynthesis protein